MDFAEIKKRYALALSACIALLAIVAFFDKVLAVAILSVIFLFTTTFLIFDAVGVKSRLVFLIFVFSFLIHVLAVLFISYANFQPFGGGGGNYIDFHIRSQEVYNRILDRSFSFKELAPGNYYPLLVGYLYALTLPHMLIGQLFNAWLSALVVVVAYLTMLELGGSRLGSLITSIAINIYPSFIFFGSLLLAEALVAFLVISGLFLAIRLIKAFSLKNLVLFYVISGLLLYFRFIVGFALLLTFTISWILFSKIAVQKKIIYSVLIIFLLGFLMQLAGHGYYGVDLIKKYNLSNITDLSPVIQNSLKKPSQFLKSFFGAFIQNLLGPFPWQVNAKQAFALFETLPWFFLFIISYLGATASFKRNYKPIMVVVMFSLLTVGIMALFFDNFGVSLRIRIPVVISLLCLVPLSVNILNRPTINKQS